MVEEKRADPDAILAGIREDGRGVLTVFNQVARGWHGLPPEPLPAEKWAEHYGWCLPDGITFLKTQNIPLFRALQGERVADVEMMIVPRQGEARTVLAFSTRDAARDINKVLHSAVANAEANHGFYGDEMIVSACSPTKARG